MRRGSLHGLENTRGAWSGGRRKKVGFRREFWRERERDEEWKQAQSEVS